MWVPRQRGVGTAVSAAGATMQGSGTRLARVTAHGGRGWWAARFRLRAPPASLGARNRTAASLFHWATRPHARCPPVRRDPTAVSRARATASPDGPVSPLPTTHHRIPSTPPHSAQTTDPRRQETLAPVDHHAPPSPYRWAGGLLSPPYTTLARVWHT
eukprot:7382110-Prymnesium_polylepis.2